MVLDRFRGLARARDVEAEPAIGRGEIRRSRARRWIARGVLAAIPLAAIGFAGPAGADDLTKIDVTIKDHVFSPAEIHVPAGKPSVLTIRNEDPTVEEFDSSALHIEKVIAGGTYGTVRLRPLGPGRYPFMGEFHSDTAQGVVVSQ